MEMVVLDIVRESSVLLCANLPILFFITLTLIFPVSSITLSHVFSNGPLAEKLSSHFHRVAVAGGLLDSPINKNLYIYSSQALFSHVLCFPITISLWLLAKTAILYIVDCYYVHREASILGFLHKGPKLWSRLATTYLYTCILVLGFAGLVMVSPLILLGITESLQAPGSLLSILETPLVMVFCVAFAHMLMVFDVANVVSVAEKRCGGSAVRRALSLLKGRVQVALTLLVLAKFAAFMAEGVFQNRVLGAHMPTNSLCEAPVLIFLYSFIHLFRTIMSFVFYRWCLQETCPACQSPPSPDFPSSATLQHLSITVEITEQCRKM
ncbi:hypothetical protein L7F22_048767 [Adiantum nelumboides]|nr:hypothetical protein [Adiantum nelumboides]